MKLLLVGPYPPPHGGVSVHVWSAHALMKQTGQTCGVLNIEPRAPKSDRYIKISGAFDFMRQLAIHVLNDWTLHVHTNGHNPKSWIIAFACGIAAQFGPGGQLTLHSGLLPAYLNEGPMWRRTLARLTCVLYDRVSCVNTEIASTIASLGLPSNQLDIKAAFLPMPAPEARIPDQMEKWLSEHAPVLSSTMFFRPEYGFDLLVQAVSLLRKQYPRLGCLVLGDGENRPDGFDDTLLFTGDVDHDLCLALIVRSSVFVRPTYRDGDSISVREALSLGVPVVASNVGTRPEGTLLFEAGDVQGLVAAAQIPLLGQGGES